MTLRRATSSASSEMSLADDVTLAEIPVPSPTATHPLPVHSRGCGSACVSRELLERRLNEQLGLGPGYQDRRCDFDLQVPELPAAGDVRERFARRAASNQRFVVVAGTRGSRFVPVGQQPGGIPMEHVLRQQAGVQRRFVVKHASGPEAAARVGDEGVDFGRHRQAVRRLAWAAYETAVASFSFSDW